jgi:YD repeat-containing protein
LRLTNESQKISTVAPKSVRYEYDAAGRKSKMTYPDNSYIRYGYNAKGWLVGISNSDNTAIVIYEYDNAGQRKKRTLENSTFTVYEGVSPEY